MKRLLFVDDAPEILSAIRRSFFDSEYDVLTADSAMSALDIMKTADISLVVSDLRMPEMDGYQLLAAVKKEYPHVIRIILSGYSDEKLVLKALQKNVAKVYLLKPWDNDVLRKLVDQLFCTEDLLRSSNVLSLINNVGELPTVKQSYRHILSLIDQDAEIPEIIRSIETDQSIAAKILHIANSAFYGLRTGSVAQAVRYLGLNTMRSLVLTTPIMDVFSRSRQCNDFAEQQLDLAMRTNRILSLIYERYLHKKMDDMSNIAGLLHNVGKTLLYTIYQKKYYTMLNEAAAQGKNILDAERDVFGVSYAEVGGYLLQWWDMPFAMVEAAVYHNSPFDERIVNQELVMAVHLAKKYAAESMRTDDNTEFCPQIFGKLGIEQSILENDFSLEQDKWQRV